MTHPDREAACAQRRSEADRAAAIARIEAAVDGGADRPARLVALVALRTTRTLAHARRVITEQPVMDPQIRSAALALLTTTEEDETDA